MGIFGGGNILLAASVMTPKDLLEAWGFMDICNLEVAKLSDHKKLFINLYSICFQEWITSL